MTPFKAVDTEEPLRLHAPLAPNHRRSDGPYDRPPGMEAAMDVAMLLGVPLLLTGEPGTGKTQAAVWLSHTLRKELPLTFDVKATTSGADLLYSFDDVGRFRDGSRRDGEIKPLVRYLGFNALGEGILRAAGGRAVLSAKDGPLHGRAALNRNKRLLDDAFGEGWEEAVDEKGEPYCPAARLLPDEPAFAAAEPQVRVVLIDELDKAPRDTPNDLLAEVEKMSFLIPELGLRVGVGEAVRPVVVITSNSEKALPAPFLRRCAYFDVPLPEPAALADIAAGSVLSLNGGGKLITEAVEALIKVRETTGVRVKPATGQLLAWLEILGGRRVGLKAGQSLKAWIKQDGGAGVTPTLSALLKDADDVAVGRKVILRWAGVDVAD